MWRRSVFLLCAALLVTWTEGADSSSENKENGWCKARQKDMYLESDKFWEMPADGRKCKAGQMYNTAEKTCVACPVGSYNFEDARVDACFPCPFNTFANETGMTECRECQEWSEGRRGAYITLQHGSTSSKQCVRPDPKVGNFVRATVGFHVKVKGGDFCTNIKNALWGISRVAPFDGHFYKCHHQPKSEEAEYTAMSFELTLPRNFAWDFWMVMDMIETHRAVGNSYVKMGRHFVNKIAEFVRGYSEMNMVGIDMKTDMLKIDDIELMEFKPYFKGHCKNPADTTPYCNAAASEVKASVQRYYVRYTLSSNVDCKSNAGYTRVRNAIEHSGNRKLACLKRESERCSVELVSCKDKNVIAAVVNTFTKSTNAIAKEVVESGASFADDDIQFNKVSASKACDKATLGIKDDFTLECGDCGSGKFINNVGMCQPCPFGTWGDNGVNCNACDWNYQTPWWGMNSSKDCLETDNEWKITDGDWTKSLRDLKGENRATLGITPQMNMCGAANAVKAVKAECQSIYSATDLVWNDALDFEKLQIQRIVCMGAHSIKKGFTEVCEDNWNKSWDQVFKNLEDDVEDEDNWADAFCYVFKKVKDLDEGDTSDGCKNLDPSKYMMSMPASFNFSLGAEASAVLVPIMKRLRNLETMNFASFAEAGKAMMTTMGIQDLAAFTGWKVANKLKDLGFEVARGFTMAKFDFDAKYRKSDFVCANGEAKRRCDDWCDQYSCRTYEKEQIKNKTCKHDECNNCAAQFFWKSGEAYKEVKCASCEFPKAMDNGTLVRVSKDNVGAQYRCNDGHISQHCNSMAKCDYNSDPKKITFPKCVEDKCQWPKVENAEKFRDWRDEQNWNSCPYAMYRCNEGYMAAHHHNRVECKPNENFRIENHMKCIKACTFPDKIDHGKKVDSGRHNHGGYWARYECESGYVIREGDRWVECRTEEREGQKVAVTKLPKCQKADSCSFPDNIGKACKVEEWFDDYRGSKEAHYQCPEGMDMDGNSHFRCKSNDTSQVDMHDIKCHERVKCEFPEKIEGGRRVEHHDHHAKYECNEGYRMEGSEWSSCDSKSGKIYHVPKCVKGEEKKCEFPEKIDNGRRVEHHEHHAKYECNEGYRLEGSEWATCDRGTGKINMMPKCVSGEEKKCEFPEKIDNGRRVEEHEHHAKYQCNEGYRLEGSEWASCDRGTGKVHMMPKCVSGEEKKCKFPEKIEGGRRVEEHEHHAKYECNEGYKMESSSEWATCDKNTGKINHMPKCAGGSDGKCRFPDMIFAGYKLSEGAHEGEPYAVYGCLPPFVMTPNKDAFMGLIHQGKSAQEAYGMMAHIGGCHNGQVYLPSCHEPMKVKHCGIPNYIENGKAVEFYMKEHDKKEHEKEDKDKEENRERSEHEEGREKGEHDKEGMDDEYKKMLSMMPMGARYQCNEGFKMHKTIKGDWGWCRKDGSFEVPRCDSEENWNEVQFKLHNGNEKRFADKQGKAFAGMVLARTMTKSGPKGDWEYGCNDGFNYKAAGAICRSLGWRHGAQTPLTRKMQVMTNMETEPKFGWTGFHCKADDALASSASCKAMRYEDAMKEQGMKARCFPFDRIAVKCFNDAALNVTVSITNSNTRISCRAMAHKELYQLNLKAMKDVKTRFLMDDKEIEGVQRYKIKKGYFMKVKNLKDKQFKCLSCEIHVGDKMVGKAEKCKDAEKN